MGTQIADAPSISAAPPALHCPPAFVRAGVAVCGAGNGLTAVGDTSSAGTLGGDAVCLLSAALYAVYTVAIRMRAPDDLALFFGLLGAFNAVIFAPLVLVLHFTGAEDLGALSWEIGGLHVGKGLVDYVLSDYLWAQAVLLTSPSAVSTVRCETSRSPHTRHSVAPGAE